MAPASIPGTDESVPSFPGTPISEGIFRAARAHRAVASNLLRETGLYAGQEVLMLQLWERGEQRQADLIKALGLDPSTVTRMVQRLEQSGFVTRRPSPFDRRTVMVSATRAGHALRGRVEQAWSMLEVLTTEGLSDQDRGALRLILRRIEENLASHLYKDLNQTEAPVQEAGD